MAQSIMLVKTETGLNNNKYYRLELRDDGSVFANWGRVGAAGQSMTYAGGQKTFDQKLREKKRKGYQEVEVVDGGSTKASSQMLLQQASAKGLAKPDFADDARMLALVDSIVAVNAHDIATASGGKITLADGVLRTPLGVIGKTSLDKADELLVELNDAVTKSVANPTQVKLLEQYLMLVPQKVGARRGWEQDLLTPAAIGQQLDFVKQLRDSLDFVEAQQQAASGSDAPEVAFRYKMGVIEAGDPRFVQVEKSFQRTLNSRHVARRYKLVGLYDVFDGDEPYARYTAARDSLGNEGWYWHGTRASKRAVHPVQGALRAAGERQLHHGPDVRPRRLRLQAVDQEPQLLRRLLGRAGPEQQGVHVQPPGRHGQQLPPDHFVAEQLERRALQVRLHRRPARQPRAEPRRDHLEPRPDPSQISMRVLALIPQERQPIMRKTALAVITTTLVLVLSGCAGLANWGENFNRQWKGASATMQTFNEKSQVIDKVHGTSIQIARDTTFDTSNSDGTNKNDSQVLLISIGSGSIRHVGSTLVLNQDGLTEIMTTTNATVDLKSTERGTPWLNRLREQHQNLWAGKSKTILIRSQNGTPLAVYTGNEVEIFATDVPKSTQFRVDGKLLFVYRADFTVIDNDLLR